MKWLRKKHLKERYGYSYRHLNRLTLPPPEYPFGNAIPAWRDCVLDKHDQTRVAAAKTSVPRAAKAASEAEIARRAATKTQPRARGRFAKAEGGAAVEAQPETKAKRKTKKTPAKWPARGGRRLRRDVTKHEHEAV
jgi:hypothetical protein